VGVRPSTSSQHGRPLGEKLGGQPAENTAQHEKPLGDRLGGQASESSGEGSVIATAQQREQQQQHNSARIPSERGQGFPLVATSSSDDGDDSEAWNPEGKVERATTGRNAVCEQQSRFLQQESAGSNPEPGADQRRRRSAISRPDPRPSEQRGGSYAPPTTLRRDATPLRQARLPATARF
jgi:hypothetical protein